MEESLKHFNTKSDMLMEKLKKVATNESSSCAISMAQEINNLALDIIAESAFGMDTDTINHPDNRLNKYISSILQGLVELIRNPLLIVNFQKYLE